MLESSKLKFNKWTTDRVTQLEEERASYITFLAEIGNYIQEFKKEHMNYAGKDYTILKFTNKLTYTYSYSESSKTLYIELDEGVDDDFESTERYISFPDEVVHSEVALNKYLEKMKKDYWEMISKDKAREIQRKKICEDKEYKRYLELKNKYDALPLSLDVIDTISRNT